MGLIIPMFEHSCGTINPQRVENLRVDQGKFQILSISVICNGCGKEQILTDLLENDSKAKIGSQKK